MDASKIVTAKGDPKLKINDAKAARLAMANALRDMADEIEAGDRTVTEVQTQESVDGQKPITSILFIRSVLKK